MSHLSFYGIGGGSIGTVSYVFRGGWFTHNCKIVLWFLNSACLLICSCFCCFHALILQEHPLQYHKWVSYHFRGIGDRSIVWAQWAMYLEGGRLTHNCKIVLWFSELNMLTHLPLFLMLPCPNIAGAPSPDHKWVSYHFHGIIGGSIGTVSHVFWGGWFTHNCRIILWFLNSACLLLCRCCCCFHALILQGHPLQYQYWVSYHIHGVGGSSIGALSRVFRGDESPIR